MTKRLLAAAVVAATLAVLALGAGEARAQRWPAKCTTFGCVNSHMNNLHSRLRAQSARVNRLNAAIECIGFSFVPASSFGSLDPDDNVGYLFENPPGTVFNTTAVDWDFASDAPDFFLVAADPECLDSLESSRQSASPTRPRAYDTTSELSRKLRVPVQ